MSRPAKHTPETIASLICGTLYGRKVITEFNVLAAVKIAITDSLESIWPTRKARAKKDGGA